MEMKKLSIWVIATALFVLLIVGEVIHGIYLMVTVDAPFNFIGFGAEILLFLLAAMFCWQKEQKRRREEERAGPLLTEQQKAEKKTREKEPIVIVPEGKPYLVLGIVFYVLFFISVVVVLLWFTWPRALLSVVLAGISGWDIYKYMKIKNDLTIAQTQADIMKRKREARKAALERQKARQAEEEAKKQEE